MLRSMVYSLRGVHLAAFARKRLTSMLAGLVRDGLSSETAVMCLSAWAGASREWSIDA
ncbi:hypothetical protein [Ferrimicrobium sp.]|uniref:hypothetical protein n=1 Tax=Ferrimicrobium sp. TaxID=2926050 RepID=UPI0026281F14|nr:hypothetical protein [Ferrimicrobium sp.]